MTGSLRAVWEYTIADVWEPLARRGDAPDALFGDLYDVVDGFLSLPTAPSALTETRSDPLQARAAFCALKGSDFANETAVVEFLEAARESIADYEVPGLAEQYDRLLADFLRKYNLRYRLDEPFRLRFLLPASFSNLYEELQRTNAASDYLRGLLTDFEHAFDRYTRTRDDLDLRPCISAASNYVEGLASVTCGQPGGTLGALCDQIKDWPHDKMKQALQDLYRFCSDYPGTRHGGNPAGKRRNLTAKDAALVSLLLLSFAGYLTPNVDNLAVLGA